LAPAKFSGVLATPYFLPSIAIKTSAIEELRDKLLNLLNFLLILLKYDDNLQMIRIIIYI